jgi:hypothetical protein
MSHDLISDRWDDFQLLGTARAGASAPTLAQIGTTGIYALRFAANDEVHTQFEMPHGWNLGTLKFHIHMLDPAAWASGTMTWTLDYIHSSPASGSSWGTPTKTTLTANSLSTGTAWTTTNIDFADINLTSPSPAVSHLIACRLALTANTTGVNPFLISFAVHFQRRRLGTLTPLTDP